MTLSTPRPYIAVLFGMALCVLTAASAQPHPPHPTRTLSLSAARQLRPGVEALPVILAPDSPAAQRVNATLSVMNKQLLASLRECDATYNRSHPPRNKTAATHPLADWKRRITVTMKGPRLLAILADDLRFCDNSYPNRDRTALVFDMENGGQPVDWRSLMTESAEAVPASDASLDGAPSSSLVMPALTQIAEAQASPACKQSLNPQGDLTFLIWPDAKRGKIVVQATGLPHAVQACETEIALTAAQARRIGFADRLLALLAVAHPAVVVKKGGSKANRPAPPLNETPSTAPTPPSGRPERSAANTSGYPDPPARAAGMSARTAPGALK